MAAAETTDPIIVDGGIEIQSPLAGTVVQPGQTVTVIVQPDSGLTLETASLVTYQTWLHLEQTPFQFSLTVPASTTGILGLLVSARDTDGIIHMARTSLQVVPTVDVSRMSILPATVTFNEVGVTTGL
jgi:hypothetical protein